MHKVWRGVAVAAAAFALVATHAQAATSLIPGKIAIVKATKLAKIVSKSTFTIPASVTTGSIEFLDTGGAAGDNTYALTAGTWKGLGNPAGSKGWKYKGTKTVADPCAVVLIKASVLKAVCKGAGVTIGGSSFAGDIGVILTTDSDEFCAQVPPTTKNDPGNAKGKDAGAPGSCPTVSSTCCAPERITLTSSAGTLTVDGLPPFPFPTGVTTIMDVGPSVGGPACQHPVEVAAGNFFVPNFDLPALNYCSSVTPIGCDVGTGYGSGMLWDGHGVAGVAMTNILATADTADGVCDTTVITPSTCVGGPNNGLSCTQTNDCPSGICGGKCVGGPNNGLPCSGLAACAGTCSISATPCPCTGPQGVCNTSCAGANTGCNTGAAGNNTVGDIDRIVTASPGGGVRSLLDIKVHSLTWSDSACSPATTPGCCPGSDYNPGDGDIRITEFDFILRPSTGTGTGRFADKNGNGCRRAGSGFPNPLPDGPYSLTGSPAAGPCCVVGQPTAVVSVGVGLSGGAPLYDLGFQSTIPNTVSACGAYVAPSTPCTPTTDSCLQ